MWYIHIVEYYSAVTGNEILIHATTWVNLKNAMVKEVRYKKALIMGFHSHEMFRIGTAKARKVG